MSIRHYIIPSLDCTCGLIPILLSPFQDNMKEMPIGMLLVGNKVDLEEQNEREVSTETGETFAKVGS